MKTSLILCVALLLPYVAFAQCDCDRFYPDYLAARGIRNVAEVEAKSLRDGAKGAKDGIINAGCKEARTWDEVGARNAKTPENEITAYRNKIEGECNVAKIQGKNRYDAMIARADELENDGLAAYHGIINASSSGCSPDDCDTSPTVLERIGEALDRFGDHLGYPEGAGPGSSGAQDDSDQTGNPDHCVLAASTAVWLDVHNESRSGRMGSRIAEFKLERGKSRRIDCKNQRIRYVYKIMEHEDYRNETGMWCKDGDTKTVP